jgi:hypothetical protein
MGSSEHTNVLIAILGPASRQMLISGDELAAYRAGRSNDEPIECFAHDAQSSEILNLRDNQRREAERDTVSTTSVSSVRPIWIGPRSWRSTTCVRSAAGIHALSRPDEIRQKACIRFTDPC